MSASDGAYYLISYNSQHNAPFRNWKFYSNANKDNMINCNDDK